MLRDILKQMLPFFVLLLVLWILAEILLRTLSEDPGGGFPSPPSPAPRESGGTSVP